MTFQSCLSFAFGGLLKVYDDIIDIPTIATFCTPQLIEIIKVFIIASFTYVTMNNTNFILILFVMMEIHMAFSDHKCMKEIFYTAGRILSLVLCMLTFSFATLNWTVLLTTAGLSISSAFDHKLFPEDHSWKKIIYRLLCVIGIIFYINYIRTYIDTLDCDILLFSAGYLSLSIIIMTYVEIKLIK
jgi:hypothetical protein